jgi:hypothetical protein
MIHFNDPGEAFFLECETGTSTLNDRESVCMENGGIAQTVLWEEVYQ